MHRTALTYLELNWIKSLHRKPLIIRGARQVGKTWIVRQLAKITDKKLIELNFEKQPQLASLFNSNDPNQILIALGAFFNQQIDPQDCLVFLDEIQAAPELLSKLRWFAEDMPQLPLIAAGSLLEFTLENHTFSMPVGRISYLHLEPLSFEEFLLAQDKSILCDYLENYHIEMEIPFSIHQQLTDLFKEYIIIGGMPAAVSNWITEHSLTRVHQIHHDLLATYRDDFAKYSARTPLEAIDEVMMSVPKRLGQKFIYSKVNSSLNTNTIKQALSSLNKARICHPVLGCSANGIPLSSEIKEKYIKEIFLDTGLCNAALGVDYNQIQSKNEITLINNGALAEQVSGQLLRTLDPFYVEPALYYWHRDQEGSSAEVDYVIQHTNKVVPLEVKAGVTGTLKSLHLFMGLKELDIAIRINSDTPSQTNIDVKNHLGKRSQYSLLSIPFYLIGQIHRLLNLMITKD